MYHQMNQSENYLVQKYLRAVGYYTKGVVSCFHLEKIGIEKYFNEYILSNKGNNNNNSIVLTGKSKKDYPIIVSTFLKKQDNSQLQNINDYLEGLRYPNILKMVKGIQERMNNISDYMKNVLTYAFENCRHPRIHIYGLGLRIIPYAVELAKKYGIGLSVDNTKWTRACSTELRNKYYPKVGCIKSNRQEFFDEYLRVIKSRGVGLQNDFVDRETEVRE